MNCIEFLPFGSYLRPIQKMAKGGTTSVSKPIYLAVEHEYDSGDTFYDLQSYLKEFNDFEGTEYATVDDFNDGEHYRNIYVISPNDIQMAKGETSSVSKPIYLAVDKDSISDSGDVFYDLERYLKEFNDFEGTEYATVDDFNDGEHYRNIYVINPNDTQMARGGQTNLSIREMHKRMGLLRNEAWGQNIAAAMDVPKGFAHVLEVGDIPNKATRDKIIAAYEEGVEKSFKQMGTKRGKDVKISYEPPNGRKYLTIVAEGISYNQHETAYEHIRESFPEPLPFSFYYRSTSPKVRAYTAEEKKALVSEKELMAMIMLNKQHLKAVEDYNRIYGRRLKSGVPTQLRKLTTRLKALERALLEESARVDIIQNSRTKMAKGGTTASKPSLYELNRRLERQADSFPWYKAYLGVLVLTEALDRAPMFPQTKELAKQALTAMEEAEVSMAEDFERGMKNLEEEYPNLKNSDLKKYGLEK